MSEQVKCIHCGELPGFVKHSESDGKVYWALECDCKSTPYYKSSLSTESVWASVTSKQEPKDALKLVALHTYPLTPRLTQLKKN